MPLLHKEYLASTYSASETDKLIRKYIDQSNGKEYFDELIQNDESLDVFFHLSSLRNGLLSWYEFNSAAEVLEVDAGFGALTGFLCEKCAQVTATEPSQFKAESICKRYSGKDNLEVYIGKASEINFAKKFDYILLAGVLERIGSGSLEQSVYSEYLNKIKGLLKPNGKLLLAVENRYGLRYFCGEADPHTNKPFDGINRYPNGTTGCSFSKKELSDIISSAGFINHKFYYPLPDYKITQLVYTDEYLPDKTLSERLIPYYSNSKTLLAYENSLYNDIAGNNAFPFLANSFFVECSLSESSCSTVFAAITADRIRECSFATTIHNDGTVKKTPLYSNGIKSIQTLYDNTKDLSAHGLKVVPVELKNNSITMPYIKGDTLSNYLKELIKTDKERFLAVIDNLYQCILQSSEHADADKNAFLNKYNAQLDWGVILKKAYIELIQLNCFYINGDLVFFDQEFAKENYPAKFILFRALLNFYAFAPYAEKIIPLQTLKQKYGLTNLWEIFKQEDSLFQTRVRRLDISKAYYKMASVDFSRMQQNAELLGSGSTVFSSYMKSEKTKSIRKVQLDLLKKLKEVCEKNNLSFFIMNGTLLGAVRHKDFIPWDDDIDVALPRADYDKLKKIAELEFASPYFYQTPENDPDCFYGGYCRLRNSNTTGISVNDIGHSCNHGIWIDIMPLDSASNNKLLIKKKSLIIKKYQKLLYAKVYGNDCDSFENIDEEHWNALKRKARFYTHKQLCKKLNKAFLLYKDDNSEYIAVFAQNGSPQLFYRSDFEKSVLLEFAGEFFPAPNGYKRYLEMSKGKNYMELPPIWQRIPHHAGIFDADRSYCEYNRHFTNIFEGAKGKTIVVFGAGMLFEDYFEKHGKEYKPEFLADNDKSKWGIKRHGISIKSPDELLNIPKEKLHLIICNIYYRQIEKQLKEMGICDYKIYAKEKQFIAAEEEKGR